MTVHNPNGLADESTGESVGAGAAGGAAFGAVAALVLVTGGLAVPLIGAALGAFGGGAIGLFAKRFLAAKRHTAAPSRGTH